MINKKNYIAQVTYQMIMELSTKENELHLDAIAKKCRVSKKTIYSFYPTKELLIVSTFIRSGDDLKENIKKIKDTYIHKEQFVLTMEQLRDWIKSFYVSCSKELIKQKSLVESTILEITQLLKRKFFPKGDDDCIVLMKEYILMEWNSCTSDKAIRKEDEVLIFRSKYPIMLYQMYGCTGS